MLVPFKGVISKLGFQVQTITPQLESNKIKLVPGLRLCSVWKKGDVLTPHLFRAYPCLKSLNCSNKPCTKICKLEFWSLNSKMLPQRQKQNLLCKLFSVCFSKIGFRIRCEDRTIISKYSELKFVNYLTSGSNLLK